MPQLDKLIYIHQIFWLILLLILFYYLFIFSCLLKIKFNLGLKRFFVQKNLDLFYFRQKYFNIETEVRFSLRKEKFLENISLYNNKIKNPKGVLEKSVRFVSNYMIMYNKSSLSILLNDNNTYYYSFNKLNDLHLFSFVFFVDMIDIIKKFGLFYYFKNYRIVKNNYYFLLFEKRNNKLFINYDKIPFFFENLSKDSFLKRNYTSLSLEYYRFNFLFKDNYQKFFFKKFFNLDIYDSLNMSKYFKIIYELFQIFFLFFFKFLEYDFFKNILLYFLFLLKMFFSMKDFFIFFIFIEYINFI